MNDSRGAETDGRRRRPTADRRTRQGRPEDERRDDADPPGPDGLPFLGSVHDYVRDPYEFVTRNAREYGDVVRWEAFGRPMYQLTHPDDVEHVLVQHNERYVKGDLFQRILGPVTGEGLLNSEGAAWRRRRHLVQPAFEPGRIAEYADLMVRETEATTDDWSDGELRDLHADATGLTLRIVAEALFGVDIREEIEVVGEALSALMDRSSNLANQFVPPWVPTPANRRVRRTVERLDEVVYDVIARRRANPTEDDVVSALLTAGEDGGLSDEEVRDEVVTLLLAGHETTALAITFAGYLLASHPEVERRLVAELDETLDGRPEMSDLRDLSYLDRIVTETMRLYPPVPEVIREPTKPDEVGGYRIPAGATVSMSQWVVHRDPRWYDDPLAFRPDRWTDDLESRLPRLAYFPFAAGPRRCIGDRFARMEAKLVLARIYSEYHLELSPGTSLELQGAITTRPTEPVEMIVHERR